MKTEPTDIDREAARLFVPAPGMRVSYYRRGSWGWRWVINTDHGMRFFCERWLGYYVASANIDALDTDDPATVGCMLAQVEDAAGESVEMVRYSCLAEAVWTCDPPGALGRTRGAALVAAMRAIKVPA